MRVISTVIVSSVLFLSVMFTGATKEETIPIEFDSFPLTQPVVLCEPDSTMTPLIVDIPEPKPEPEVITLPYTYVTEDERDMLARLVYLEAGACSLDCQIAIASVIFNRLDSGCWTSDMNNDGIITLYDIIYFPTAFSPAHTIQYTTPSELSYEAVDYVVQNGPIFPTEVRYFRIDYDFSWANYVNYCVMENVYFGYLRNWQEGAW